MSAFVAEYPDVVRAVVSDVGIITDIIGTQVQAVRCKALWDTGGVYSVISNLVGISVGPVFLLEDLGVCDFSERIKGDALFL